MNDFEIRSSDPDWLASTLKAYGQQQSFKFVDDGNIGVEPGDMETGLKLLVAAARKGECSWQIIAAALVGLGMAAAGIWMVRAALVDPEPTSRLTLLITGGLMLATTGGAAALNALGTKFEVHAGSDWIEVKPAS